MVENEEISVVLGATGGAGGAVVRELVRRGARVRAVTHRGRGTLPAGVEAVRGDATDAASMREACRGAAVVYHCAGAPYAEWADALPRMTAAVIEGAAAAGARLVYADNLYAYGPVQGPLTEDTPPTAATRKGALRARIAETLLEAHRAGRVRVALGRASDFYGPGALNAMAGERVFARALAGQRALWLGSLDAPHSLTFIDDFARVLITLGAREEAWGRVWHAPDAGALTGREFLSLVFAELGRPPRLGSNGRTALRLVGLFSAQLRELGELMYQFEQPFVLDGSRYTRAFGEAATPHREAIRTTLAWYRRREA